jgi:superfamily II DNA or RNA helicase
MTPATYSVRSSTGGHYPLKKYLMAYCHTRRKSIIQDDCLACKDRPGGRSACPYMGGLSSKVNFSRMMLALSEDEIRNQQIVLLIRALVDLGHHVLVFSKYKQHLKQLRDLYGGESSLYHSGISREALQSRVTFSTLGMGEHGLDAPWKSAVVLAMPLSNPEQAVGRIERVAEGKKAPLIVDPYVDSDFLRAQWRRRVKFYAKAGYKHILCPTTADACDRIHNADAECGEDGA